jgi:4-hydroxybenzoate polyprenyltransferase
VAAAVFSGQLSIGWSNDALDGKRDKAAQRSAKPVVAGLVTQRELWLASAIALVACVPLSLLNGELAGLVHLSAVGSAWVYNLALKSTIWSWLPYAYSFGALPVFVQLSVPTMTGRNTQVEWWAAVVGALLGVAAHFANVLPDLGYDSLTNVRGLPQRVGKRASILVIAGLVASAVVVAVVGGSTPPLT